MVRAVLGMGRHWPRKLYSKMRYWNYDCLLMFSWPHKLQLSQAWNLFSSHDFVTQKPWSLGCFLLSNVCVAWKPCQGMLICVIGGSFLAACSMSTWTPKIQLLFSPQNRSCQSQHLKAFKWYFCGLVKLCSGEETGKVRLTQRIIMKDVSVTVD